MEHLLGSRRAEYPDYGNGAPLLRIEDAPNIRDARLARLYYIPPITIYFLLFTLGAPIALFLLDFALGLKSKHNCIQYSKSSSISIPVGSTKRKPFRIFPVKSMWRTPGFLRE